MSRMTEVLKIMYSKDGRCHEVSASRMIEARRIMCVTTHRHSIASYGVSVCSRMTEVIKIMCAKVGRRYEVSVSRMTEARKNICVNGG